MSKVLTAAGAERPPFRHERDFPSTTTANSYLTGSDAWNVAQGMLYKGFKGGAQMTLQTWNRISRIFFIITLAMATLLAIQTRAEAAVCKVKLEDIGTITGKGATKNLAFEDAASQCFDKKAANARRTRAALSEDTGISIIDICANVRCDG